VTHTLINAATNAGRHLAGTTALALISFAIGLSAVYLIATPTALARVSYAPDDASDVIKVVRQTVNIDYGVKISITTVVDSGTRSIERVRALFRPRGGSTVWSYDYPDFVVEGESISVSFEIATGPGSYYPPGTEFEIEIEVTGPDGTVTAVRSPVVVEYLDPARDWKRKTGDGYTIVYYGVPNSDVDDLIAKTDARIPTLRSVLGVPESSNLPDFKAVVFPSVRDATPSFPPVSQTATDQFLFAGFARAEYRLFVQGEMNPTTFVHELAHLYTHEAVSSSFSGGVPSWLGEGLARFLETGSTESSLRRLRSSVRPEELLLLRHMGSIPGQRRDISIFYPQAGAFVGYLVEEYGAESMAGYLAALNGGNTLLSGFEQTYGKSLYEVENDWRIVFGADELVIPSATSKPDRPTDRSSPGTPVPLVDFSMGSTSSSDSTGDPAATAKTDPVLLPESTPQTSNSNSGAPATSGGDSATGTGGDAGPDYLVVGLVTALLIVIGAWFYSSPRSRRPKPGA
jgi:hypothetical protein